MARLIVLLRGINVGGHNKVPMGDLRATLTDNGFANVATYIQSGNIALDTDHATSEVAERIEQLLSIHFGVEVPIVSVAQIEIAAVLDAAPFTDAVNPSYQLIFSRSSIDTAGIAELAAGKYPGDTITATANAVYVEFAAGQSASKLTVKALETAAATTLTGRNVRSATKLLTL